MKTKLGKKIIILLIITLTTGCTALTFDDPFQENNRDSSTTSNSAKWEEDILRDYVNVAFPNKISSYNPLKVSDALTASQINLIGEGLYRQLPNEQIIEGAIERAEVSEDGKTIYYYIKEEAYWSNRQPVLAEDFEWAWKALLLPDNNNYFKDILNGIIVNATQITQGEIKLIDKLGVRAINDKLLEINLENPYDTYELLEELFAFPALYPIPSSFLKNNPSSKYGTSLANTISNGPYLLEGWESGSLNWKYSKNLEYWNHEEYSIPVLNFKAFNVYTEAKTLFEEASIDMLIGYPSKHNINNYNNEFHLIFNIENKTNNLLTPFSNQSIRDTIFNAIDTDELESKITYSSIEGSPFFNISDESTVKTNNELALTFQETLDEMGYEGIEVNLLIDETDISRVLATELISQIGSSIDHFSINIVSVPNHTFIDYMNKQNYDFAIVNQKHWGSTNSFDGYSKYLTGHSTNTTSYSNQDYDELLTGQTFASILTEEILSKANTILKTDSIIKPLISTSTGREFNEKLIDIEDSSFNASYDFKGTSLIQE